MELARIGRVVPSPTAVEAAVDLVEEHAAAEDDKAQRGQRPQHAAQVLPHEMTSFLCPEYAAPRPLCPVRIVTGVVVDTSVLIDHLRGMPEAKSIMVGAAKRGDTLCASVLTRIEVLAGMRVNEGGRDAAATRLAVSS